MIIRDSAFQIPSIVTAKDIACRSDSHDSVQHILAALAPVKRYIQFPQPPGNRLYHKEIPVLTYQRQHAVSHIGVDKLPVTLKDLLER
jgi:hypothetical protein